ncbi:MAG TPA: DUF1653 domain-containing protein [Oxalicibacterium sp.]|nr:DUF1653 domain-containing protein [Oxalicibacterium sp.]
MMHEGRSARYRHYKGGIYEFVCAAKLESDPKVVMIVYTAADGSYWTRPESVFFETVEHQGRRVPRFAPLDDAPA